MGAALSESAITNIPLTDSSIRGPRRGILDRVHHRWYVPVVTASLGGEGAIATQKSCLEEENGAAPLREDGGG